MVGPGAGVPRSGVRRTVETGPVQRGSRAGASCGWAGLAGAVAAGRTGVGVRPWECSARSGARGEESRGARPGRTGVAPGCGLVERGPASACGTAAVSRRRPGVSPVRGRVVLRRTATGRRCPVPGSRWERHGGSAAPRAGPPTGDRVAKDSDGFDRTAGPLASRGCSGSVTAVGVVLPVDRAAEARRTAGAGPPAGWLVPGSCPVPVPVRSASACGVAAGLVRAALAPGTRAPSRGAPAAGGTGDPAEPGTLDAALGARALLAVACASPGRTVGSATGAAVGATSSAATSEPARAERRRPSAPLSTAGAERAPVVRRTGPASGRTVAPGRARREVADVLRPRSPGVAARASETGDGAAGSRTAPAGAGRGAGDATAARALAPGAAGAATPAPGEVPVAGPTRRRASAPLGPATADAEPGTRACGVASSVTGRCSVAAPGAGASCRTGSCGPLAGVGARLDAELGPAADGPGSAAERAGGAVIEPGRPGARTGRACSSRAARASARRRTRRETRGDGVPCSAGPGPRTGSSAPCDEVPTPATFPGGPPAGGLDGGLDRRERVSAGVVMRPTDPTSGGRCIGTVRGASRLDAAPGAFSVGTRRTTLRSPRPGSSPSSATGGTHQRGGRVSTGAGGTEIVVVGPVAARSGVVSRRRTRAGRPQPRAKRTDDAATRPRPRRPATPPRWRATIARPSWLRSSGLVCSSVVIASWTGSRCGRPRGSR